jgi:ferredoxin
VAVDSKWLKAQLNLAKHLALHLLRRLWPWTARPGLAQFHANYVVEGLPPATATVRAELAHTAGKCTACGACDAACPILLGARDDVDAADFMGPQAFVLAGARQLESIGLTLDVLVGDGCQGCRACDRACPEGISVTMLAKALRAQERVVDDARRRADAGHSSSTTHTGS